MEREELHNTHLGEIEDLHAKLAGFEAKIEAHIQRFEQGVSEAQGCADLDRRLGMGVKSQATVSSKPAIIEHVTALELVRVIGYECGAFGSVHYSDEVTSCY